MSGLDAIEPGMRFGPYQVDARLGEGGMAVVARGHHTQTGEQVALKILTSLRRAEVPGLVDRLHREASVIQALDHIPYVVGFVEVFRDQHEDGRPGADVLVLEYIEGRSLQTLLGGVDLEVMQVLEWMGHACHALHDMHQAGFVHRDLKPDNLMLTGDPDLPLRIIDFNSAGSATTTQGRLTRAQGTFPYTPAYLAPECFDGVPADASADVYALGITFGELLLGRHPLLQPGEELETNKAWQQAHEERAFPDLTRERPEIPAALQQILADATATEREDRIADAVELWERLKAVWDALQAAATPVPGPPTVPQPVKETRVPVGPPSSGSRVPMVVAGLGVLVVLGAAGAGGMWWMEQRRLVYEAEVERLEAERIAAQERRAEEERQRLEAERREQERLEKERQEREAREKEAELRRQIETRAAALGATAVAPVIEDAVTLDKLKNSTRFGSHQLYESTVGMGRAKVEQIGDVLFFEGIQGSGNNRVVVEGVITKVDARGFDLDGRISIVAINWDGQLDRCGRRGKIRMGSGGHPHYFRAHGDCKSWHYLDLLVDEAWLEEHPSHKPQY